MAKGERGTLFACIPVKNCFLLYIPHLFVNKEFLVDYIYMYVVASTV